MNFFLLDDPARAGVDPQRWNRYVYVRNNPQRYVDPDGRAIETGWDAFNVGLGLGSSARNLWQGDSRDAAWDAGGVLGDVGTTFVPGLPGGFAMRGGYDVVTPRDLNEIRDQAMREIGL